MYLHNSTVHTVEGIQQNFTSKIKGLEQMDYHKRLKKTGTIQSGEEKRAIPHNKRMPTVGRRKRECTET